MSFAASLLRLRLMLRTGTRTLYNSAQLLPPGHDRYLASKRWYAVAKKAIAEKEDKSFVDLDAEKLCSHVCINYFTEGEEPGPKILPDDQYPSWLFELDLRGKRELEDMDPETDGWLYWRALKRRHLQQELRFRKLQSKFLHLQQSPSLQRRSRNPS